MTLEETLQHIEQIIGRKLTDVEVLIVGLSFQQGIIYHMKQVEEQ